MLFLFPDKSNKDEAKVGSLCAGLLNYKPLVYVLPTPILAP